MPYSLPDMVAKLESNFGAANASQPSSMVNPTYGQYGGFVQQYGSGPAGVNNFASSLLQANPNATVGDFYAGYVRGTGTPGQYSWQDLVNVNSSGQRGAEGAATNFLNNSGYDPNTPLSSVMGGSGNLAQGPIDQSSGLAAGSSLGNYDTLSVTNNNANLFGEDFSGRFTGTSINDPSASLYTDPNAIGYNTGVGFGGNGILPSSFDQPANVLPTTNVSGGGATIQQAVDAGPDAATSGGAPGSSGDATTGAGGGSISGTGFGTPIQIGPEPGWSQLVSSAVQDVEKAFGKGTASVVKAAQGGLSNVLTSVEDWFVRWGLVALGVVIIVAALIYLMKPDDTAKLVAALATKVPA